MCIVRGRSVSDSFIAIIGEQIALRRPVLAPSGVTLQALIVVLTEVNWQMRNFGRVARRVTPKVPGSSDSRLQLFEHALVARPDGLG